jgi:hypothetical protein
LLHHFEILNFSTAQNPYAARVSGHFADPDSEKHVDSLKILWI